MFQLSELPQGWHQERETHRGATDRQLPGASPPLAERRATRLSPQEQDDLSQLLLDDATIPPDTVDRAASNWRGWSPFPPDKLRPDPEPEVALPVHNSSARPVLAPLERPAPELSQKR